MDSEVLRRVFNNLSHGAAKQVDQDPCFSAPNWHANVRSMLLNPHAPNPL
jgi:hypothetical protein